LPGKTKKRIFLITSPGKGDGKSTTTSNLAVSIALQNDKVLLIDANLRNPIVHHMFSIPNRAGLTELLTNQATFDEVINETGIGKLDILTSGTMLLNPAELLESEAMAEMLEIAANTYSMILIDSPSILKFTETRVLANQCDGTVLVVNRRKTKLGKLVEARKVLELVDATLVGAIVNEK